MRIGPMRHRVQLLAPPSGNQTTVYGDIPQTAYAPVALLWARIEDLSASELMRAQQIQPDATTIVRIRFRSDVTFQHRIYDVARNRTLEIVGPPKDTEGRSRELEMFCREVAAGVAA